MDIIGNLISLVNLFATSGFAGADLANMVNEAALLAARVKRKQVEQQDLNEAIERVVAGLEKKSRVLQKDEKKVVAYHEVGHAIVGHLMPGGSKVAKISIVPRGMSALGYTLQLPTEERFLNSKEDLQGQIATLLGGRSAEEIVFCKTFDIKYRIMRIANVYGEDKTISSQKNVLKFLIGLLKEDKPITLYDDGMQLRDCRL